MVDKKFRSVYFVHFLFRREYVSIKLMWNCKLTVDFVHFYTFLYVM